MSIFLGPNDFEENTLKLLHDFLVNWSQCIFYVRLHSSFMEIQHSIPQGSTLSPLLFSLHTPKTDLYIRSCKYYLYALLYSFDRKSMRETVGIINSDLEKISEFSTTHDLHLDETETSAIMFDTRYCHESVENLMEAGRMLHSRIFILVAICFM